MPIKTDKVVHAGDIQRRIEAFNAISGDRQKAIDKEAVRLRSAFGTSANWTVWGKVMMDWDDLAAETRQHWREAVMSASLLGKPVV